MYPTKVGQAHVFDISLERILEPIMHLSTLTKVIIIRALTKLITIECVLSYFSPHNFASLLRNALASKPYVATVDTTKVLIIMYGYKIFALWKYVKVR